jgi:hypothetical protein
VLDTVGFIAVTYSFVIREMSRSSSCHNDTVDALAQAIALGRAFAISLLFDECRFHSRQVLASNAANR